MLTQAQQAQRTVSISIPSLKGVSVTAIVHALIAAHGDNAHRFAQAIEREVDKALDNNQF